MPFVQYSERENKVQRVLVALRLDSASRWPWGSAGCVGSSSCLAVVGTLGWPGEKARVGVRKLEKALESWSRIPLSVPPAVPLI